MNCSCHPRSNSSISNRIKWQLYQVTTKDFRLLILQLLRKKKQLSSLQLRILLNCSAYKKKNVTKLQLFGLNNTNIKISFFFKENYLPSHSLSFPNPCFCCFFPPFNFFVETLHPLMSLLQWSNLKSQQNIVALKKHNNKKQPSYRPKSDEQRFGYKKLLHVLEDECTKQAKEEQFPKIIIA